MAKAPNDGRLKNGLYKRGTIWYVDIQVQGRRIRKSVGPDRKTAELVVAELKKRVSLSRMANDWSGLQELLKPASTMTFAEAAQAYMLERPLKHSSQLAYQDRLARLMPVFGSVPLVKIDRSMIAKFRTSLRSEVGTERINNCINLLRAVLEIAVRDGHIKENPAKGLGSLEPTEIKEEIDPLTREELDLILRVIPAKYRPIFICLAWTGARPGELKALRWSDVDWRAGEISISKTRYKGQEGTTKTKSGKRRVMMLPPVLEALKQLKAAQSVSELTGHVFVSKDGTLLDHLDRVWASALKKAGMRHRPSYQLRHTFASLCLSAGIEPGLIGRWLGHSGPQITLKHYARFIVDTKRDNQRFLNALFRSNEQDKSVSTDVSTVAMDVA